MNLFKYVFLLFLLPLITTAQSDTLYSFFVAGHSSGVQGRNNIGLSPSFKDKFPLIKANDNIQFGILTGDIVSPFPDEQDWIEVDQDIDTLGLPVYFTVGNHDMENRPVYENRYGKTYYKFLHENDLFIVLDPNVDGWNISGEQLNFFKETIDENSENVDNIFIAFHQILWRTFNNEEFDYIRWNTGAGRADTINFWSTLVPYVKNTNKEVIFLGGDYGTSWSLMLSYDKIENLTFIGSGMANGDSSNFLITHVLEDKSLLYEAICLHTEDMYCFGSDITLLDKVDNLPVNITNLENLETLIYPNPTSGTINITNNPNQIEVFTPTGQLVYTSELQYKNIDISHLDNGLYFLVITEENKPAKTVQVVLRKN